MKLQPVTVSEVEPQKIVWAGINGCDCGGKCFVLKRAQPQHLGAGRFQRPLRDGLGGRAVPLALGVVGRTAPDHATGGGFPAVVLAAARAADQPGKYTGRSPLSRVCRFPLGQFRLHRWKIRPADNGLVVILHIELGELSGIDHLFLRQVVQAECLLQEQVSSVLLIFQNRPNGAGMPFTAQSGRNSFFIENFTNFLRSQPREIEVKNPPDNLRLLRH